MPEKINEKSNKNGNHVPVQSETLTLIKQQFFKTKMCPFQKNKNFCLNESNCHYAHSLDELKPMPNLRNTKLCDFIKRKMPCQNPNCKFAHDIEALKPSVHLVTYKSAICSFWCKGKCFNGDKCRFAHGDADMNKTEDLNKLEVVKTENKAKTKPSAVNLHNDNNKKDVNVKNNSSNNKNNSNKTDNKNNHTNSNNTNKTSHAHMNNNMKISANVAKNVHNHNMEVKQYTASTHSINTCDEGMNCSVENTNSFFFEKSKDTFFRKGNNSISNNSYNICNTVNNTNSNTSDNNGNGEIMSSKLQLDHLDRLDLEPSDDLSRYTHRHINNLQNLNSAMENKQESTFNHFNFEENKKYSMECSSVKDIMEKIENLSLSKYIEDNDKYAQMIKYLVNENTRLKENLRHDYTDSLILKAENNKKPFSFENARSLENSKMSNSTDFSAFLLGNDDLVENNNKNEICKNNEHKSANPINAPTFEDPNKTDDNFSSIIKTIDDILISQNVDSFSNIKEDQLDFGNEFQMEQENSKETFSISTNSNTDIYKNYENLLYNMKSFDVIKHSYLDSNNFLPVEKSPKINKNHFNKCENSINLNMNHVPINETVNEKSEVELLEKLFQQNFLNEQLEKKKSAFVNDLTNRNDFGFNSYIPKNSFTQDIIQPKQLDDLLHKKKFSPLYENNSQNHISPNIEMSNLQKLLLLQSTKNTDFPLNKPVEDINQEMFHSKNNFNANNNGLLTSYEHQKNNQISKNIIKERNAKLNTSEQHRLNENLHLNLEKILEMSNGKTDILKKIRDFISNELQQTSENHKYHSNTKINNFSNEASGNGNSCLFNEVSNGKTYDANKNVPFPNFYKNEKTHFGTINNTFTPATETVNNSKHPMSYMQNQIDINGISNLSRSMNKITSINNIHANRINSFNEKSIWNDNNNHNIHSTDYTYASFANDWVNNNKSNDFFSMSKSINLESLH